MKKLKKLFSGTLIFLLLFSVSIVSTPTDVVASSNVDPEMVDVILSPGESITIPNKEVITPAIPPVIDVCLLSDETGSFGDDIANLKSGTTASDIYVDVTDLSPDAYFAVTGFRDYPQYPYGDPSDWVYRLSSGMSSAKADWISGINGLSAGGGRDIPEAQYDAIVAAVGPGDFNNPTLEIQGNCGWRSDPNVKRFLVVTTDAPFHTPDGTHLNDQASTVAALNDNNITVIGLKAPGAGGELDALAAVTGGSVQPLSSDGANIATAIIAGLSNLLITVTPQVTECDPLSVVFTPTSQTVTSGGTVSFTETITVPNDASLEGTSVECSVIFTDEYGNEIGDQVIKVEIPDTTPPVLQCIPGANPSGKNIPPAGKKSNGMNEDGFYKLIAFDNVDNVLSLYINGFGAFASGDTVKITEAPGAEPSMKKIGSKKADNVVTHLILDSDAILTATDSSGNESSITCYVPPMPK